MFGQTRRLEHKVSTTKNGEKSTKTNTNFLQNEATTDCDGRTAKGSLKCWGQSEHLNRGRYPKFGECGHNRTAPESGCKR